MKERIPFISSEDRSMRCAVLLTLALMLPNRGVSALPTAVAPPRASTPLATAPASTEAPPEHLTAFVNGLARLDWSSEGWRLTTGAATLKDFGRRESDARQALRLIRELRLNQHGTIGGQAPSLEYWLADGQPPRGPATGLHTLPIDGASLRVEQTQTQWVLRDNQRVLFNFGNEQSDARQALAVIRKYGFTEVGSVNPAAPSMVVFFAQPDAVSTANLHSGRSRDPARLTGAPDKPAPDPLLPAGRLLAQHPGVVASAPVAPAVPPLWQVGLSGNSLSATSQTPDRTPFDWRQVQLRKEDGGWKLAAGSCVLADFGADEHAARLGLSAVQYYRFTERRQVGGESARFTYFLVGGQPPRGAMFGADGQPFQLNRLQVRQIEGRWTVCDGDQPLVEMGDKAEEANQVLDLIRRQQVDRLCRLGAADGRGMTFLVRSR
jgi:hypothetical protein